MKKKIVSLVLVAAFAVSMFAGCGNTSTDKKDNTSAKTETGSSESFDLAVNFASEPQTIDPQLNTSVDGGIMTLHMFEGLMKWVSTGEDIDGTDGTAQNAKLAYGQAESYEKKENDDGTVTYTFKLRDDIKWSDGQDVTAGDFEYAWKRLVDPATAADYSYMLANVVNAQDIIDGKKDASELAVSAPDDKTFEVTLTNDIPYFEEICAFPATLPVRKDTIEKNKDQWTFKPETYITNGAYKMTEWEHNSKIVMAKNDQYYDVANLGPQTITFKLMDDANAMLSSFNSGELDYIQSVPQAEIPKLLASNDLKIVDYLGTYYVCFQNQKAPFDNKLVREAFTLAIDRSYIVNKVTQAGQVEANAFVPPAVSDADGTEGKTFREVGGGYYKETDADYEANCKKAKELLAKAGYPDGKGFPAVEYMYNNDAEHKAVAEALQYMWEDVLGVKVKLNNQDWNAFIDTRKKGNYQIARHGWIGDYNDPITFLDMWVTNGGNNDAKYSNKKYDKLIKEARSTSDVKKHMELLHQAEDQLIGEDYAICPLYFYTQKYMLAKDIKGMYYCPLGYFFFGYTHK